MGLERTICVLNGQEERLRDGRLRRHPQEDRRAVRQDVRPADEETRARLPHRGGPHAHRHLHHGRPTAASRPSNVDQGYVLRRLIRRAVRYGMKLGMPEGFTGEDRAGHHRPVPARSIPELARERAPLSWSSSSWRRSRFAAHAAPGQASEFDKAAVAPVRDRRSSTALSAFHLYDTYGFPIEITMRDGRASGA